MDLPKKSFRSIRIKALLPIVILQGLLVITMLYVMVLAKENQHIVGERARKAQLLNQSTSKIKDLEEQIQQIILLYEKTNSPGRLNQIADNRKRIDEEVQRLERLAFEEEQRDLIDSFKLSRQGYSDIESDYAQAVKKGDTFRSQSIFRNWLIKTELINASLSDLSVYNVRTLEEAIAAYQRTIDRFFDIGIAFIIGTLILVLSYYVYIRRGITHPLALISLQADRLTQGYFGEKITIPNQDEIGALATDLNILSDKLAEYQRSMEAKVDKRERELASNRDLDKRKNEFISMASHELKTPVTTIKLFSQMLRRELKKTLTPKTNVYLERLERQVDRLNLLVSDLLDVSKMAAGKLEFRYNQFNLADVVEEIVDSSQTLYPDSDFKVVYNSRPEITADQDRVSQVIINFISNAVKYGSEHGPIILKVEELKYRVRVSVSDKGEGIPRSQQAKIFRRFYQVEDKHQKAGLGIGLYICKRIIEEHHGVIGVKSGRGKGSTFFFTLPISPQKSQ